MISERNCDFTRSAALSGWMALRTCALRLTENKLQISGSHACFFRFFNGEEARLDIKCVCRDE